MSRRVRVARGTAALIVIATTCACGKLAPEMSNDDVASAPDADPNRPPSGGGSEGPAADEEESPAVPGQEPLSDAGASPDAGAPTDAGARPDAAKGDAGPSTDAGTSSDAGTSPDAGQAPTLPPPTPCPSVTGRLPCDMLYDEGAATGQWYSYTSVIYGATATDVIFGTPAGIYVAPLDATVAPERVCPPVPYSWPLPNVIVTGGAVGIWRAPNSLSVWTRATGLVSVGTTAADHAFVASSDGARIAYSEAEASGSTSVRVRQLATTPVSLLLTGTNETTGNGFNTAALACPPAMAFVGKTFLAEYCTGTSTSANVAKLVAVLPEGNTIVRLDAASVDAPPTLKPVPQSSSYLGPSSFTPGTSVFASAEFRSSATISRFGSSSSAPLFRPDASGSKVMVVRNDGAGEVLSSGSNPVVFDADVAEGMMLPDGSAVIYRSGADVLKKATTTSPPVVTTLATGVKGLLGRTPDGATVFFYRQRVEQTNYATFDVHAVVHGVSSPVATTLVQTATTEWAGVNGTGTHLVFSADIGTRALPLAGGPPTVLSTERRRLALPASASGALTEPSCPMGCASVYHLDLVTGQRTMLGNDVEYYVHEKNRVVFTDAFGPPGVFAATIP